MRQYFVLLPNIYKKKTHDLRLIQYYQVRKEARAGDFWVLLAS